jgi:hypothetical protein
MRLLFQAGGTQAIEYGEILEFTGNTNTALVPIDSDFLMSGHIAIANQDIISGDRAGYYEVIIPRPDDVFEFALATAGATAVGQRLYYSSSEAVTTTGTHILGNAVGLSHYPDLQGRLTKGATGDAGVTISSYAYVQMTFAQSASYYSRLVRQGSALDLGDSGGFSGILYDAANTTFDTYIDGTQVGHIGADGVWTDDVG